MQITPVIVHGDAPTHRVVTQRGLEPVLQERQGGIAEARNLGLRAASTPLVGFIDDDARARPGWVQSLVAAFDTAQVGAAGGPVIDTRTGEQVVHEWWVDPFGTTHRASEPSATTIRTPTLNGCNMGFRREALRRIGGFDPYYRYYYDETDVCARLARAGYAIRFQETAVVNHDFAEGPTRERFLYYSSRMRAYFSLKNYRDRVPASRLLVAQIRLLRDDLHAYRRHRPRYVGAAGTLRACREIARGRLEGILDGVEANPGSWRALPA